MPPPKRILVVAGSDSSGGAGLQADVKTISALGGHASCAVTAITVQDSARVHAVHAVAAGVVAWQMETALTDPGADAVKIGMLATPDTVRAVAAVLARHPGLPVVLDPVAAASGGAPLLTEAGRALFREELLPRATLLTPNLAETAWLSGHPADTPEEMEAAGLLLARRVPHLLVKGGHLPGECSTHLYFAHGALVRRFHSPRLPGPGFHGTGCTLAAALALLGGPHIWEEAIAPALAYVEEAARRAFFPGPGQGFLCHAWPGTPGSGILDSL